METDNSFKEDNHLKYKHLKISLIKLFDKITLDLLHLRNPVFQQRLCLVFTLCFLYSLLFSSFDVLCILITTYIGYYLGFFIAIFLYEDKIKQFYIIEIGSLILTYIYILIFYCNVIYLPLFALSGDIRMILFGKEGLYFYFFQKLKESLINYNGQNRKIIAIKNLLIYETNKSE